MTIRRMLTCAFWAALLFAFVMAVLPKPPQLLGAPSDKIQHILAFTTLAALAAAAYPRASLIKIGLLLAAFGALIEVIQAIPALHRDGSFADWFADISAVAIILLFLGFLRKKLGRT